MGAAQPHMMGTEGDVTSSSVLLKQIYSASGRTIRRSRSEKVEPTAHSHALEGNLELLKIKISSAGADVKDPLEFTPLHFAACYGHLPCVEFLLEQGAGVSAASKDGLTPLHLAARNGHTDVLARLLKAGADFEAEDSRKGRPLHNASGHGNVGCVRALLEAGADKDAVEEDKWAALHYAARFNNVENVEALLLSGADVNAQDVDGWTAMHNSSRNGRLKCCQVLLQHKADVAKVTNHGETALHVAVRKGKAKVVQAIVDHCDKEGVYAAIRAIRDKGGKKVDDTECSPHIKAILRQENQGRASGYDMVFAGATEILEESNVVGIMSRACSIS